MKRAGAAWFDRLAVGTPEEQRQVDRGEKLRGEDHERRKGGKQEVGRETNLKIT